MSRMLSELPAARQFVNICGKEGRERERERASGGNLWLLTRA